MHALATDGLYLRLRALGLRTARRGRYELLRVKSPATRLPPALQATLLDEFAGVTDALYQADTSFHWRKDPDYFRGIASVWLVFLDGELCGFTAIRLLREAGERILYIDNLNLKPIALLAVGELTVGAMLVYEMLKATFPVGGPPMSVVFRTQNPNVYRLAYSVLPVAVYPRLASPARDPARCRRVLAAMAARLSPGRDYDADPSVIRSAYGGYIYGRPLTQSIKATSGLARFWREHVRLDAGDAVLITVCPTHAEVRGLVYGYVRRVLADRWRGLTARWRGRGRTAPAPAAAPSLPSSEASA